MSRLDVKRDLSRQLKLLRAQDAQTTDDVRNDAGGNRSIAHALDAPRQDAAGVISKFIDRLNKTLFLYRKLT